MIRFGSRGSDLALAQSRQVAAELAAATGETHDLTIVRTRGDRDASTPLPEIGGKGLFTAELEEGLLDGAIDVAVHSLKDLPVEDRDGLTVGAVPVRAEAADVLVFRPEAEDPEGGALPLRPGATVGTSSPRRHGALRCARPDLVLQPVRGNVPTRVDKVRRGDHDAVVLAAAGLQRLDLSLDGLRHVALPVERFTPAPGQGALGIQCRRDDTRVRELLAAVHDAPTAACAHAERRVLALLGGGCSMPLGVWIGLEGGGYRARATLYTPTGAPVAARLAEEARGDDPDALATGLAGRLRPFAGDPLGGRRLWLPRPDGQGGRPADGLRVAGARVDTTALTETHPEEVDGHLTDALGLCRRVAFTSARAVTRWFEIAAVQGIDTESLECFAGGPRTAEALRSRGIEAHTGATSGGADLAGTVAARGRGPVLFPCARDRHPDFEERLSALGVPVRPLPVYRTRPVADAAVPEGPLDAVILTAPSAVKALPAGVPESVPFVAIGPTTAAACREAGRPPAAVAADPTPRALLAAVQEVLP